MRLEPERATKLLQDLSTGGGVALQCEIVPVAPALTFSSRFQAGYVAHVPLSQFHGEGHTITALVRLTPRDWGSKPPFYLLRTVDLPKVAETDFTAQLAGAFYAGEGHYQTSAILFDDAHRWCHGEWQLEVKAPPRRVTMEANSIDPIARTGLSGWGSNSSAKMEKLTVFLHAAPLDPRLSKMQGSDVVVAISSLTSLLEQVPSRSVRLVVFNLRQDKELYRTEALSAAELEPITRILDGVQMGMVDYHALQNQNRPSSLLKDLIEREAAEDKQSNAVVFMGPDGSYGTRDQILTPAITQAGMHFFYLQYKLEQTQGQGLQQSTSTTKVDPRPLAPCQVGGLMQCNPANVMSARPTVPSIPTEIAAQPVTEAGSKPEEIASVVRRIKGKVFTIRDAGDFVGALDRINRIAGRQQ